MFRLRKDNVMKNLLLVFILLCSSQAVAQLDPEIPRSMFQPEQASSSFLSYLLERAAKFNTSQDPHTVTKNAIVAVCLVDATNLGAFSLKDKLSAREAIIVDKCRAWAARHLNSKSTIKTPFTKGKLNSRTIYAAMDFYMEYLQHSFPQVPSDIKLEAASCVVDWVRTSGNMQKGLDLIVKDGYFGFCAKSTKLSSFLQRNKNTIDVKYYEKNNPNYISSFCRTYQKQQSRINKNTFRYDW